MFEVGWGGGVGPSFLPSYGRKKEEYGWAGERGDRGGILQRHFYPGISLYAVIGRIR